MKIRAVYIISLLAVLGTIMAGCVHRTVSESTASTETTQYYENTESATENMSVKETPEENFAEALPLLGVESGTHLLTFTDETTMDYLNYYVHIPENPKENLPLIIYLHGDGEVNNLERLKLAGIMGPARELYGEKFPFICICPNTRFKTWTEGKIPGTLKALIDYCVETYRVDRDHIIITGHSRGSWGAWYMINKYGSFFSAAVPVSCPYFGSLKMETVTQVPVWAFVGTVGSPELQYRYMMKYHIDMIRESGGKVKFSILEGDHHNATDKSAYSEATISWMLNQ